MSSIAVLINVCNHREQALECLAGCYRQFDTLAAQDESLSFSIYVHDDAGTDGLLEAVRERFPQVHLMHSDSVQYWCTGLRMLWEEAAREDFDFYIWLDYNLRLDEGCFGLNRMPRSRFPAVSWTVTWSWCRVPVSGHWDSSTRVSSG